MTFIEARGDMFVNVYGVRWAMTELTVGEIGGEGFPTQGSCEFFEDGGRKTGNKFVRSVCIVL